VLVASLVVFFIGLAGIFVGLAGLISPIIPAGELLLGGFLYLILSVVLFVAGVGLLKLRTWAWWLALLTSLGVLAYSAYAVYRGGLAAFGSVVTLAVAGLIFVYLLAVSRHFRRPSVAPA